MLSARPFVALIAWGVVCVPMVGAGAGFVLHRRSPVLPLESDKKPGLIHDAAAAANAIRFGSARPERFVLHRVRIDQPETICLEYRVADGSNRSDVQRRVHHGRDVFAADGADLPRAWGDYCGDSATGVDVTGAVATLLRLTRADQSRAMLSAAQ